MQANSKPQTGKSIFTRHPEILTLGVAVTLSLILRFVLLPWDTGGTFFHVFLSIVALSCFAHAVYSRRYSSDRLLVMRFVLLPVVCVLLFSILYFDLRAILPFALACALIGAIWFSSGEKAIRAIYLSITLLLTLPLQFCGWQQITRGYRLRNIDYQNVSSVELIRLRDEYPHQPATGGELPIQVTSKEDMKMLVDALKQSSPYSPNREHLNNPWQVTVIFNDGQRFVFKMGHGIRSKPDSVLIEMNFTTRFFGSPTNYQNAMLYSALKQDLKLPVWE